eukprot:NODE_2814_length_499_cov_18.432796_g2764_i0.p1 GENE.NODE_2814_length_499_cov_18.432796_g2764_i0~~NODE_2814_length_499_cov_18.432796_g2764_i0.p1  ORF type:complete len:128 (+),score=25.89 NODE_2814_length_499_cov_18.432796_g2764_i0:64-447(+)
MQVFQAAQPALLYLSPACILAVLLTATIRGELKAVFAFNSDEYFTSDKDKDKNKKGERNEDSEEKSTKNAKAKTTLPTQPTQTKPLEIKAKPEETTQPAVSANNGSNEGKAAKKKKKKKTANGQPAQ